MKIFRSSIFVALCFFTVGLIVLHYILLMSCRTKNFHRETKSLKNGSPEKVLEAYFSQVKLSTPVLIIDSAVLNALNSGGSLTISGQIKVAVEKRYQGSKVSDNDEIFEIIYYEKPEDVDYWVFIYSDGTKRATLPFEKTTIGSYSVPAKIDLFLQDWEYSRFLECSNIMQRTESSKRQIPLSYVDHFSDLRDFIKTSDNAHLVACGGTLLGWYRECSIIPHTTDVDFFIRFEEYSESILKSFKRSRSPYRLFRIYGLPDDSYELAVTVKGVSPRVNIDLFSMYTTVDESWMGGLAWSSRKKFKWTYPRMVEFCTGDLLGHLIYVPCNVEDIIEADYGFNWREDRPSEKYVWYNSSSNVTPNGKFSKEEMRKMRSH